MILIKIGGGTGINLHGICQDLKELTKTEQVILVHGASTTRDKLATQLNAPSQTITSPSGIQSVYTDQAAIDVFLMSYAGLVNKKIVAALLAHDIPAIGLSGIDGRLWQAKRKNDVYAVIDGKTKLIKDNLTGKVEHINTSLIDLLISNQYLPVLCPPAISTDHEIVNTDNDTACAVLARECRITKIVALFEAPGMLAKFPDESSLVSNISCSELSAYLPHAQGRMKKKIIGAQKALESGVKTIYWGDSRTEHPIQDALAGKGTTIQ